MDININMKLADLLFKETEITIDEFQTIVLPCTLRPFGCRMPTEKAMATINLSMLSLARIKEVVAFCKSLENGVLKVEIQVIDGLESYVWTLLTPHEIAKHKLDK